jgi:hypothetical protein
VAACRATVNAELMLDRDGVHVAVVQKVGGLPVGLQILFLNLKTNNVRILITVPGVIDRNREAPALRMPRRYSFKQVGCERCDAAFARQVVTEKRDSSNAGYWFQALANLFPRFAVTLAGGSLLASDIDAERRGRCGTALLPGADERLL